MPNNEEDVPHIHEDDDVEDGEEVDDTPPMQEPQPQPQPQQQIPHISSRPVPQQPQAAPQQPAFEEEHLPGEGKITAEQEIAQLRKELGEIKQVMVYQAKQQQAMMQQAQGMKQGGGMGGLDPNTIAAFAPLIQTIAPALVDRLLAPKQIPMVSPAQGAPAAGGGQGGFEALLMELMMKSIVGNIEMNNSINNLIKERISRSIADDIYEPNDTRRHRVVHQGQTDVERTFGHTH